MANVHKQSQGVAGGSSSVTGSALECQDCKWWQADDEDDEDNTGGKCRRYPPTVHAGTWGIYFLLMKTTSTHWPDADAFDYCGEHTPNDPSSPTAADGSGGSERKRE